MVAKSNKAGAKRGKAKVGNLKLNKETVKDLTVKDVKNVKGGAAVQCTKKTDLKTLKVC